MERFSHQEVFLNFGVVPEALDRNYQVEKICFSYLLLVTDIILIVVMQISMQVDLGVGECIHGKVFLIGIHMIVLLQRILKEF